MNINPGQITEKLSTLGIEKLAIESGFDRSSRHKVDALSYVASFFYCIGNCSITLQGWANSLMSLFTISVSKQAMDKRSSQERQADFCQDLLNKCIETQLSDRKLGTHSIKLLEGFEQVYLQDSTCLSLPEKCAEFFPGSHSNAGNTTATARLQVTTCLRTDELVDVHLTNYRKNDQGDAYRIIEKLKPGDLLIRDQGYFVLDAFKQIEQVSAFYLSRLKAGVHVFDANDQQLDLLKAFKSRKRNGITVFEQQVKVGAKAKLDCRMIVTEVPEKVFKERKAKALKNRSAKANHSQEYLELLRWNVLLTNAPASTLPREKATKIYRLRWRIEILFKCWKSAFKLQEVFSNSKQINPARVRITILLYLAYILLFFTSSYVTLANEVKNKYKVAISIVKYAKFFADNRALLIVDSWSELWVEHLARSCAYGKRNRKNHLDLMSQHQTG